MIPKYAIEEVKSRNNIVDVVSSYVQLTKPSGDRIFGLCPFHNEKTGSFAVTKSNNLFYCYGCHEGGDVITFMMKIEHLGYVEAVQRLADRVGYQLPESDDPEERARANKKKRLVALNTEAARYFFHKLSGEEGAECRAYLKKRALSPQTVRAFGLGYAPDEWSGLYQHIKDHGFSDDECMRSGLFKRNRHGGIYDLFRGRLMFPIIDITGQIIAYGGRVLNDDLPKYINSPETEIYTKGRHVFGLNLAKKTKSDTFVVVEGYMDVIALHQGGINEAIGVLGTALTTEQVKLMKRFKETTILSLDSDQAGQKATRKSLDIMRHVGVEAKVLVINDAKDPDEYIKENGAHRFRALLENAYSRTDYLMYLAEQHAMGSGTDIDPIKFQKNAIEVLADIDNSVIQELYISKVAEKLGVGVDAIRIELAKLKDRPQQSPFAERQSYVATPTYPMHDQPPLDSYAGGDQEGGAGQLETHLEETRNQIDLTRDQLYVFLLLATWPEDYAVIKDNINKIWFYNQTSEAFVIDIFQMMDDATLDMTAVLELGQNYLKDSKPLSSYFAQMAMDLPHQITEDQRVATLRRLLLMIQLEYLKKERRQLLRIMEQSELSSKDMEDTRQLFRQRSQEMTEIQKQLAEQIN